MVSNPKTENAFEFLKNQDLIIASDSSIHLEDALLNITGIYFQFGDSDFTFDYYGYVSTGLTINVNIQATLLKEIATLKNNRPQVYL